MFKRLRMPLLIGALGLLVAPAVSYTTNADDICTLRTDNDGNCYADVLDQAVIVEGIITSWKQFGVRGPGTIVDPTTGCCIAVFDLDTVVDLPTGTLVQVSGWMGQFSGLDQVTDNPADGADIVVTVLGDPGAPFCIPISGADLQDFSAVAEKVESCLVSLCGRFLAEGNFDAPGSGANFDFLAEDGNIIVVRIDADTDLVGTPIPQTPVTLCGVSSQFDVFNNNLCQGYQVFPRSLADITPSSLCDPVPNVPTTWGQVKSIMR